MNARTSIVQLTSVQMAMHAVSSSFDVVLMRACSELRKSPSLLWP